MMQQNLGPDWEIEIFEAHHNKKVDSPSGTALLLGSAAAQPEKKFRWCKTIVSWRLIGKRKKDEIGFSVVRGGNVVGEHSIKYFNGDERLEINHIANDRSIFAKVQLDLQYGH